MIIYLPYIMIFAFYCYLMESIGSKYANLYIAPILLSCIIAHRLCIEADLKLQKDHDKY